ncbi:MAG: glycosyltransferase, partial [Cyanobacteria bacterium J06598_3]
MKVAFLVGRFPVLSEAFIVNQITGLLARGHDVDIYALSGFSGETKVHPDVEKYDLRARTTYAPVLPENFLARLGSSAQLLARWGWQDPLLCLRALNIFRYGKTAASLRFLHLVVPFLGGQSDDKSYDIIHCQFGTYGLLGVSLREMGAIAGALVTTFRGFDISEYPRRQGKDVYQRLFDQGDLFFSNCEFFRQRVMALGGDADNIVVHGSSIDCDKFSFQPRQLATAQNKKTPLHLVTVGRLTEKKGLAYGIRAVAKLLENTPFAEKFEVRYHIIGEGHLRGSLQQLIEQLGLSDCVSLLGKKQQAEIIEHLSWAHLFIAPCVTASTGDQDAPVNTLKEAMAMGLPVVSTWHGGIPELV